MTRAVTDEPHVNEFVITRVFDAPRELVFRAWTEPEHFARWWGSHEGYSQFFDRLAASLKEG